MRVIKNGITYLAPNSKYQFYLTVLVKSNIKEPIGIKVMYKNNLEEYLLLFLSNLCVGYKFE